MSLQDFREGYRIDWKQVWRCLLHIGASILAIVLSVNTLVFYFVSDYDRATFTAVLVLWCLHMERRFASTVESPHGKG